VRRKWRRWSQGREALASRQQGARVPREKNEQLGRTFHRFTEAAFFFISEKLLILSIQRRSSLFTDSQKQLPLY
jgi:hypothetical protein